jgi:hypothetical protein
MANIKPTRRKVVWIFGAGASLGAGAYAKIQRGGKIYIPTQVDFWDTLLRYASAKDRDIIEAFLYRYFKGYHKTPSKLNHNRRRKAFKEVDVEEVFTFLSERVSTPTITPQLKTYFQDSVWPALIRSISSTFGKFHANTSTRAIYRDFEANHLRAHDAIVSFNYDLILEESLTKNSWEYFALNDTKNKTPILKPHGSVNWEPSSDNKNIIKKSVPSIAMIVAPTHLKFIEPKETDNRSPAGYLNTNQAISKIWSEMEVQMKGSKALIFVGYSFPDADLYFSSVLRTVLTSTATMKLILVNPDSQRIAEKICRRFSIEKKDIANHFDFAHFCKLSRKDIL